MKPGGAKRGFLAMLLALACGNADLHAAVPAAVADALRARATSQGEVRLIVQFSAQGKRFAELPATARQSREQQIANLQAKLASRALQPGMRELVRFRTIPFMVFSANANAVDRLSKLPEVISLQEDIPEYPTLASSIPVIGADTAWAAGYSGTGQVIAVLDTGVSTAHPYFPPAKLVAEACFSTNSAADKSQSLCPGQVSSSTAAGSGQNCPANVTGCGHGTHVAGIAVGNNGTGPNIGVAKGAGLISIQVFSCFSNTTNCNGVPRALSFQSDQILALEHVLALSQSFNIAAVNMSLGGTVYQDQVVCDSENEARKEAIDNLRAAGIATIIASGNNGSYTGLSQPGCISTAISVGNTTDSDAISSNSNVAEFLTLLAPGTDIISAAPGGLEVSITGTSMSAPHVAGAWAVLRQADPLASVDEILQALQLTATLVDDQRSSGSVTGMLRINLDQALDWLTAPQPEIETQPQAGSELDLGDVAVAAMGTEFDLEVTNSGDAELTLTCDISGPQAGNFSVTACPATLAVAASTDISLRCDPQAIGELGATLAVSSNDFSEPVLNYTLQCTGLGAEIVTVPVAASTLAFGAVQFNTNSTVLNVQVSNTGNQPLSLACELVGDDPGQFAITACPASVPGAGQAMVGFRCEPDGHGDFSASLQISSNDADESLLLFPLSCSGLIPEVASDPATASELDFGSVEIGLASSTQSVNLVNSGDGTLTLDCALAGAEPGSFHILQCPASIVAGGSANVELQCEPESISLLTAQLQIESNDTDEALLSFGLQCLGLPPEDVFSDSFEEVEP